MDLSGAAPNNKKRGYPDEAQAVEGDNSPQIEPKRNCPSLPTGFEAEAITMAKCFSPESLKLNEFIRRMVNEEVKSMFESNFQLLLPLLSQMNKPGDDQVIAGGSGTLNFKLCFRNQIAPTIFTNNEIKAKNGEPLQVAICDSTNFNAIVQKDPFSSAQIQFVVLDGEFGSGQRREEIYWTGNEFNKSVLSSRDGKRPLIVGNDEKLYLKNGVGFIESLSITDNSSWTKSKTFRLGVKVTDEKLGKFPRIGEAISQPLRVMDHRGEVNQKHHPPRGEDEVWRLEGIGKNGVYHNNLSSQDIKTVNDFLNAYKNDPDSLKKLLGNKVSKKTWKMMVDNALECAILPTDNHNHESYEQTWVGNEAMGGEAFNNRNVEVGNGRELPKTLEDFNKELESVLIVEDPPSLLTYGEGNTSTRTDQYYQGSWTKLVPKPN